MRRLFWGWLHMILISSLQDIFRMNQTQLEGAIRNIQKDSALDAQRKAYLMQNIMAAKYIVAQQNNMSQSSHKVASEGQPTLSYHDPSTKTLGCPHYKRKWAPTLISSLFENTSQFHVPLKDYSMDSEKDFLQLMSRDEVRWQRCLSNLPGNQGLIRYVICCTTKFKQSACLLFVSNKADMRW